MGVGRRPTGRLLAWVMVLPALAVGLAACSQGAAGGADLAGKSFVSTGMVGHELVAGSKVRIIFQEDRISVHAGCNTLTSGATWKANVLVVAVPMAQTMMACDGDLTRQDAWLEVFLTSGPALRLDGSTLVLGDSAEGLTLDEQ